MPDRDNQVGPARAERDGLATLARPPLPEGPGDAALLLLADLWQRRGARDPLSGWVLTAEAAEPAPAGFSSSASADLLLRSYGTTSCAGRGVTGFRQARRRRAMAVLGLNYAPPLLGAISRTDAPISGNAFSRRLHPLGRPPAKPPDAL